MIRITIWLILATLTLSCSNITTQKEDSSWDPQEEEAAVKKVMKNYKEILESLDVTDSYSLFIDDSQVLEQGKIEGTYSDYIANHIGPELDHFASFKFSDYDIEVELAMPYAFTTESYIYNIVLKEEDRKIERKAAATSILRKMDGEWKILKTHSSSRAVRK
jgi:ketosteroid isomerase-like protein